jgi:hypothetical protein
LKARFRENDCSVTEVLEKDFYKTFLNFDLVLNEKHNYLLNKLNKIWIKNVINE